MPDRQAHAEPRESGDPGTASTSASARLRWWRRRWVQIGGVGLALLLILSATIGRPAPNTALVSGAPAGSGSSAASTQSAATDASAIAVTPTAASGPAPSPVSAGPRSVAATEPALAAPARPVTVTRPEQANAALGLLAALPVKGRAPKTGYSRADFGDPWTDDVTVAGGHNGCDTRNDILRRDLVSRTIKTGSKGCTVASGTLTDPYTGRVIAFTRGGASAAVEIDHLVALGDAWQTGAQQLSRAERINLANDPRNLQATDGPANQAKGDGDAATWLPPNRSYRCTYVARQVEVKRAYHLWLTPAEQQAVVAVLRGCGGSGSVPVPTSASSPVTAASPTATAGSTTAPEAPTPTPVSTPAAAPTTSTPVPPSITRESATRSSAPEPTTRPAPVLTADPTTVSTPSVDSPSSDSNNSGGAAYYKNCTAARAAGAAPIRRGEPGYRSGLDRDHDGIACET